MTASETPPAGAVVLVSGGTDSATAVYEAIDRGYEPYFLHTSYGQQTEAKEHECAKQLAEVVDARDVLHVERNISRQSGN